jgi:hypothetical protein
VMAWIRTLLDVGKRPTIHVIEQASLDTWEEAERRWIAQYWNTGARLTNIRKGGEEGAPVGMQHTALTRARLADKGRNITDETRAKRSAARKGCKLSPEWRAKLRAGHKGKKRRPCAQSTKEKIASANTGNKGPRGIKRPSATREKMSAAQLVRNLADSRVLISDGSVRSLRARYADTEATIHELATDFKISPTFVYRIIRGKCRPEAGGPICTENRRKTQIKCRGKLQQRRPGATAKVSFQESAQSANGLGSPVSANLGT